DRHRHRQHVRRHPAIWRGAPGLYPGALGMRLLHRPGECADHQLSGGAVTVLNSPWRADFPGVLSLAAEGQTYLDSAATAQKPQAVLDALLGYYAGGAANVHRAQHLPGERATHAFETTRAQAATWLQAAASEEILFTRGTTESLNLLAYGLEHRFQPGDE